VTDKRTTLDDVVAQLRDGMTIGIGGWGSRRKPMALVKAICRSPVKNLTVVSYGGPDVGLLCAYKKIRKLVFGFVTLDSIPLEPHFRAARQNGEIEVQELDEGMIQWGLYAAANRLPFMPTRAGIGSDVARGLQTVTYDGTEVIAMPPLKLDVALVHMNRADKRGNAQYLGPDIYFDDLYCMAADKAFVSCEKIVDEFTEGSFHTLRISRIYTDGVVEAPGGARFTSCVPDYDRDEEIQNAYAKAAADPDAWAAFAKEYVGS
jgi:acyl CoA:acetate/3-ketoacid CoA transferase alpha subunit